jgi:hypothetical protein
MLRFHQPTQRSSTLNRSKFLFGLAALVIGLSVVPGVRADTVTSDPPVVTVDPTDPGDPGYQGDPIDISDSGAEGAPVIKAPCGFYYNVQSSLGPGLVLDVDSIAKPPSTVKGVLTNGQTKTMDLYWWGGPGYWYYTIIMSDAQFDGGEFASVTLSNVVCTSMDTYNWYDRSYIKYATTTTSTTFARRGGYVMMKDYYYEDPADDYLVLPWSGTTYPLTVKYSLAGAWVKPTYCSDEIPPNYYGDNRHFRAFECRWVMGAHRVVYVKGAIGSAILYNDSEWDARAGYGWNRCAVTYAGVAYVKFIRKPYAC